MPKPIPNSFIPKVEVEHQIKKYKYEKWGVLSSLINRDETKCIWFSRDQIKDLWEELLYQETNNGIKVSGVRAYLGCFSDDHQKYSSQLNIIFTFTTFDESGSNPDFFIEEQPDFPQRPKPQIAGSDLDHGIPCPPDCDGGECCI